MIKASQRPNLSQPHPEENWPAFPDEIKRGITKLTYLAAHCPTPFIRLSDSTFEGELHDDCQNRIKWARMLLHLTTPVATLEPKT